MEGGYGVKIFSTYSVKIKHYNHILKETIEIYREAVDYLIDVCLNEWNDIIAKSNEIITLSAPFIPIVINENNKMLAM